MFVFRLLWSRPLLLTALTAFMVGATACQSGEPTARESLPDPAATRNLTPAQQLREVSAAIERDSTNAALYLRRARLHLTLRSGSAAVYDADRVLRLDGPKPANYVLRAQARRAAGQLKGAQEDASLAVQLGYDGAEIFTLQGELAFIERKYQEAINFLNEALKKSPFEERAYFYKGMVYLETGDTLRAITSFQTAADQAPELADAYSQLAAIHNAKGEFAVARQFVEAGLRSTPDDGFLYYNAGIGMALQQQTDSALTLFVKAAQLDSTLYRAQYNAGVLHYRRDEFGPAARYLRTSLRRDPQPPPNARLMLADCLDRLGDARGAVREYSRAAQADPSDTRISFRLYQANVRRRQQVADSAAGRPERIIRLDSLRKIR